MREEMMTVGGYSACMGRMRIIVANRLASYRDTLAYTLRALRPTVEITVVGPDLLDAAVARVGPDLVICDCVSEEVGAGVRSWIEMYADHGPHAAACVGGRRSELAVTDLDALLGIVDQVEGLTLSDAAEEPGVRARSHATDNGTG